MSSDRTPAEVIAAAFSVGRGVTNSPEALAARVLDALAAAGFRVVPEPDDDTRALANFLIEQADSYARLAGDTYGRPDDQVRAELLDTEAKFRAAAAYLSGDPEEGR